MKIGIISDIHEDVTRLKESLTIIAKANCTEVVCLGDFTGYSVPYYRFLWSRNAHEVIQILKKSSISTVIGNHDLFSIRKLPNRAGSFKFPRDWYELDYQERQKLGQDKIFLYEDNELFSLITREDIKFINTLPEYIIKNFQETKILFSHYAYPDLTGSTLLEPDNPKQILDHLKFIESQDCQLGISGHSHFEGITIFTKNKVRKIEFNEKIQIPDETTWLHGPCVANGSFANGIMILNTETKEIVAIPLNTPKHKPPKWRKL